jgi:membrane associated rhomboid family serine protease
VREQNDLTFVHMMWTRKVAVTYVIFAFNILLFLVMEFAGGTTSEYTLLAFGAKHNPSIDQGEIWRFVTPIFIHIGLLHIFFNSYALWIIGPLVEKLYGGPRFLILYLTSGVGGVAASYWYHPETLSAGASGANFGLLGVLLVFVIKYHRSIPPEFRRTLGRGVLITIAINLLIGFSVRFIDNSAHIGGLITGAALAAIIPYARPMIEPSPIYRMIQAGLIVVVAASFVQVAANYQGPGFSLPSYVGGWARQSSGEEYLQAVRGAERAIEQSLEELPFAKSGDFPAMKNSLSAAMAGLKQISAPDQGSEAVRRESEAIRRELLRLAETQYVLVNDVEASGGLVAFEHKNRLQDNQNRFKRVQTAIQAWSQRRI